MGVIDYKELEKPIVEIEEVLHRYDRVEQDLILKQLSSRHLKRGQTQQAKDLMSNLNLKEMVMGFMPGGKE